MSSNSSLFWQGVLEVAQAESVPKEAAPPVVQWQPFPDKNGRPSPQRMAYESQADELFWGGSAGCGKTDTLLGLALTAHRNSIIYRRQYPQLKAIVSRAKKLIGKSGRFNGAGPMFAVDDGRILELGAVDHEDDVSKYQGRPHDAVLFDEITHFSRSQYRFLIGWNRNDDDIDQRCRVVCTGNPPTNQEGRWVIDEWAPWLDRHSPDPAEPGELRHYATLDGVHVWLKPGVEFTHRAPDSTREPQALRWTGPGQPLVYTNERGEREEIVPRSRTFIPGRVDDNPVLLKQGYKATLQALPEPLRSQMLYGDFNAGVDDDAWQCIPTEWVRLAQARWTEKPPEGQKQSALGVDVAKGGANSTVIVARYGPWFARPRQYQGKVTDSGPKAAVLALKEHQDDATIYVDAIGVGGDCADRLKETIGTLAVAVNVAVPPTPIMWDRSRKYPLVNVRAAMYWRMREALDPEKGDGLMLPPDPVLLSDLCAPRYEPRANGIILEPKVDISERIGRSPDCGDAACLALWRGKPWRLTADKFFTG